MAKDFAQGNGNAGAALTDTTGGEITLAPAEGAEFQGANPPNGWTASTLTGGSVALANGIVTIDGAAVMSPAAYGAGRSLEFVAKFTGPNQNVGFATTAALASPFLTFGVKADGQLYARSVAEGKTLETAIPGTWLGAPHRFRIDWTASAVAYSIDGAQKVSHAIAFKTTTTMKLAIVDSAANATAVMVDWIRMSPYAASGVYHSGIYDAGATVAWQNVTWVADMFPGTNLVVDVRTGDTPTPDATWTPFRAVANGAAITSSGRYAQFRLTLSTTAPTATPAVKEVVLNFVR
jgi:hypothetical protein